MKRTIKSNPENLIRELITEKYGTLDNACNTLDIGTRQGLNNNLRRWAEKEGTFKAFYKILSELGYKIEYCAIPILNGEFDYKKFSQLLDEGEIKKASKMIDKNYRDEKNQTLDTTQYLELRNQIENRKGYLAGKYRTIVTFPEDWIKSIIDFNYKRDFSENLNFIVERYLKFEGVLDKVQKIIISSSESNKDILNTQLEEAFFEKVETSTKVSTEKIMADSENIWVKTDMGDICDITRFFTKKSLGKFKVKKNNEKLKIDLLKISGNEIIFISGRYDGRPFIGEYCPIYKELKQIEF